MGNAVFCLEGMAHFGRVVSEALSWPLYVNAPVGDVDTVFIVGMYDAPTYQRTLSCTARAKQRIIQWCGTDTYYADPEYLPEATHFSSGAAYSRRLKERTGIDAPVVYLPVSVQHSVYPWPEKPAVACYIGNPPVKYGSEYLEALMEVMPEVEFIAYPLGAHGPAELRDIVARSAVQLQLGETSGGCSLREAMQAGRVAVGNGIEYPHCLDFSPLDFAGLVRTVRAALRRGEPDMAAAEFWRDANSLDRFREIVAGVAS